MQSKDVFTFLQDKLSVDTSSIGEESALVSSGLVNSLGLINFILFFEEISGLALSPEELTIKNFDTVRSIVSLYEVKKALIDGQ